MINMLAITSVVYLVVCAALVFHAFAPGATNEALVVVGVIAVFVLAVRALLREER